MHEPAGLGLHMIHTHAASAITLSSSLENVALNTPDVWFRCTRCSLLQAGQTSWNATSKGVRKSKYSPDVGSCGWSRRLEVLAKRDRSQLDPIWVNSTMSSRKKLKHQHCQLVCRPSRPSCPATSEQNTTGKPSESKKEDAPSTPLKSPTDN